MSIQNFTNNCVHIAQLVENYGETTHCTWLCLQLSIRWGIWNTDAFWKVTKLQIFQNANSRPANVRELILESLYILNWEDTIVKTLLRNRGSRKGMCISDGLLYTKGGTLCKSSKLSLLHWMFWTTSVGNQIFGLNLFKTSENYIVFQETISSQHSWWLYKISIACALWGLEYSFQIFHALPSRDCEVNL